MLHKEELAIARQAASFAKEWYARGPNGRDEDTLAMFLTSAFVRVHETAARNERDRIVAKLTDLIA